MAAPQFGSMTFLGLRTKKTYSKDIYLSDVDNGLANFDSGGGAGVGSETFWIPPEPVLLTDYAQVTGTADTEKLSLTINGVPTGDMLRYSIHLTTLNNRPKLQVGIPGGVKLGALQIAD